MRYEIQRGICDLLRVELEESEAVIARGRQIYLRARRGRVGRDVAWARLRRQGRRRVQAESQRWSSHDDDVHRAGGGRRCRRSAGVDSGCRASCGGGDEGRTEGKGKRWKYELTRARHVMCSERTFRT